MAADMAGDLAATADPGAASRAAAAARRVAAAPPDAGDGAPMSLSKQDEERIEAAIRGCERTTGGQIVCVMAQSAMVRRTALPVLLAALLSLALPWPLMALTQLPLQTVLLLQLLAFVLLLALGSLPAIERALTPPAVRRALAWRLAAEQFVVRGVSRTPDRSGILIFVARAERYARIIADEGIARQVPASQW